ncbi:hypothetical protein HG535_0F00500 [Zygotorulaspora mrakii]|uniref:BED-type domain-containing protein n=1 Tax=Zygotorulaspora mrakii TaxID=42260 RepID=A0A7H9B4M0_ZYGMR|nr:uncharacterized protein HG535_0F00500 [Zygotorulaspora mrakii]QLG73540.1 hypothetical protein HG535_0F00500 [Zygotorulaspora mrakii]
MPSLESSSDDEVTIVEQTMPLNTPLAHCSSSEPLTPPNENVIASTSNANQSEQQKKITSGWMGRSSFKSHFQFFFKHGRKVARCNYCGKTYKEGESTGNLSKHITAVHRSVLKEKKVLKMQTLDTMSKSSKSLHLTEALIRECNKHPGTLESLLLITEGFLPFNFVRLSTWSHLNRKYGGNTFIQSRTTLTKKIQHFRDCLNDTLRQNLKDTTLVNVQLDIWTAGNSQSFLAIMVSFAPNILNKELLEASNGSRLLLNIHGEASNTHLLDFVSLGDKKHTGKNMCDTFMSVMEEYDLVDKLGTITMDNASNNGNFHVNLIYDHFNGLRPRGHRLVGKVRFIRCASHVLNLQFQRIIKSLSRNSLFSNAFKKIRKLAKIMRYSTAINSSLKKNNLPLIPYESPTRWLFTWKQVKIFLENYKAYKNWLGLVQERGQDHLVTRIQDHISFDSKTINMLAYFVECGKIFDYVNKKFQDEEYNNLPQGVPLYYLLGHFYKSCLNVSTGKEIPKSKKGMDFSFLNGPDTLSFDEKNIVLEAINVAYLCYQNYLSHIQANPLYYAAVMLDPTAKHEQLYRMMEIDEFNLRMNQVNNFVRMYLNEEGVELGNGQQASPELSTIGREEDYYRCFNVHEQPQPTETYSTASVCDVNENLEEWHRYQSEPVASGLSRIDAIKWWHANRCKYPSLFKLAMSLLYTKVSSCDVERCFSLAGRVVRKDRARLHYKNVQTLMLLRDRFSKFGFYKPSPILVLDSENETDLDLDNENNDIDCYLSDSSEEMHDSQDDSAATARLTSQEGINTPGSAM